MDSKKETLKEQVAELTRAISELQNEIILMRQGYAYPNPIWIVPSYPVTPVPPCYPPYPYPPYISYTTGTSINSV